MFTNEELQKIGKNIAMYGGGFMNKLWIAFQHADEKNKKKIISAFKFEFVRYYNFEENI